MEIQNLKFKFSKKYEFDDTGSLVISGIATTNRKDLDYESITISPNAIKNALPAFEKIGSPVKVQHERDPEYGDRAVGKVVALDYTPKEYSLDSPKPLKMKITVVCIITDKQAIQDILNGRFDCFSLAWFTKSFLPVNGDRKYRIDTEIVLAELTLTGTPANPDCKFTIVDDESIADTFMYRIGSKVTTNNQKAIVTQLFIKND
jgi:hypothetical protein